MSIDLGCVQVFVSQHLLKRAHIHTILQHESGRGVPQLMAGIERGIQPGFFEALFDHIVHRILGHTGMGAGQEQGVRVGRSLTAALLQPVIQRRAAGLVEEDHALLVALAQNTELFLSNICYIKGD